MILVFIAIIISLFVMYKFKLIKNKYGREIIKFSLIALSIATILEITLFNFRHYESLFLKNNYSYQNLTNYRIGSGIVCEENNCKVVDKEYAYIELLNVDSKAYNLYLDFSSPSLFESKIRIDYTDEANKLYLNAGSRNYINDINRSHYNRLNPSGKIGNLKITFESANTNFNINKIAINKHIPLFINNMRIFITFIVILFVLLVNPFSILHELKYNFKHHKAVTVLIIALLMVPLAIGTLGNGKSYTVWPKSQYSQYKNLARALYKGQFYLDLDVSDKLKDLENPYDRDYRDTLLEVRKDYYWDYAYYNGKYYTYFGVVPCLVSFLPYYALTHHDLPNSVAMCLALNLLLIAGFYLIYTIINKYFKKTSYVWYCLLSIFFVFASGAIVFSAEPTFYNFPIIFGVSLASLGLAFWIRSTMDKHLNKKYLFLGSLCMALVSGCRPQLLLTSFFSIIIFWDYVFKKRELFSKKSLKETFIFIIPYIIVAAFIMYYNYKRFGSIFDFGANYNLTTNDMLKRGIHFDRIWVGIYYFFFAPTRITPIFPFITKQAVITSYLGRTIYESMYGGFFFVNIVCILSLFIKKFKKYLNKDLYKIAIFACIFSFIIVLADTQMAGILPRYLYDFAFLITLTTIIVILVLLNNKLLNKDLTKVLFIFILISIFYNIFTYFLGRNMFIDYSFLRLIYNKMYYLFMFWL